MLHIVNKSSLFDHALTYAAAKDEILLIEEAVFLLTRLSTVPQSLKNNITIYFLENDLKKRGFFSIPDNINLINYHQFVDLVIKHSKTLTWF